ncbi:MAG: hypothetical protein KU37_09800 [Sulfuricurvum sp. PC08-66]|nr:MAG: hypothetical protein KU37_09800 [Sulfuricurvum sp. PC08-66]
MQRNITYQEALKYFAYFLALLFYETLTKIYVWLPPLLGLAFLVFVYAIENNKLYLLLYTVGYLVVFEADNGYILLSSVLFFVLLYYLGLMRLRQIISCEKCLDYMSVALAYGGFYLFSFVIHPLGDFETPSMDGWVMYYILIEIAVLFLL